MSKNLRTNKRKIYTLSSITPSIEGDEFDVLMAFNAYADARAAFDVVELAYAKLRYQVQEVQNAGLGPTARKEESDKIMVGAAYGVCVEHGMFRFVDSNGLWYGFGLPEVQFLMHDCMVDRSVSL